MAINVLRAAKHLCKESGWTLTNLELQKIIYICHMEFLGEEDEPLVEGGFEAWDHGPVHPKLYYKLRRFRASSVKKFIFKDIKDLDSNKDQREIAILDEGARNFPHPSGPELIAITHREGGAWEKVYEYDVKNIKIPERYILDEYKELKEKVECSK